MKRKRLYHDNMYRFDQPQPSWWEHSGISGVSSGAPLASDESCDVAVIGAGYTGLSAAYHLSREHHVDVRVLEAGHIGWGASGRNAGFCGIGGTSLSSASMRAKYGLDETRRFYQSQLEAIELVRDIIESEQIDAEICGDSELEIAPTKKSFEALSRHAALQRDQLQIDSRVISAEQIREQYFASTEVFGGVVQRPAFGLHPLRYLRGLAEAAGRHGAVLHPHSEVVEWQKREDEHLLVTRGGTLRARNVILAANGFMPEHLNKAFYGRPLPMISAIIVTRPLDASELAAQRWQTENLAITSRRLLNYYRMLPSHRLLFGGRGHSTGSEAGTGRTFAALKERVGNLWPAWREIPVEYQWHGLICITRRLTPSLGALSEDPSVLFAFGYHGNGVNTATWSGRQLALWLVSGKRRGTAPDSIPLMLRGLSQRFPLPSLRLQYLQARLALFRLQDSMD